MQPRNKLLALFTLCAFLALGSTAAQQPDTAVTDLPVTRVVLFTSGVGFFEHAGVVQDSQQLTLNVAADQMDDLLQSLVLLDHDGGTIKEVRYPSEDPLQRILASYSLDLAHGPSLLQLLEQARGEPVQLNAGGPLAGTILGVESVPAEEGTTRDYLLLLTAEGLMRVALDEVRDLNFGNPALRAELHAALDAIARHRDSDDKELQLLFSGSGERAVSVAYVREMPLWKASYRLVLAGDTAQLQGWAIFDNPTSLDLNDISVSFVAGQPLSFITDLYEPVHVERPRVRTAATPGIAPPVAASGVMMESAVAPSPAAEVMRSVLNASADFGVSDELLSSSVDAAAAGVQSGASFEYRVTEPVTIGRYESALIPVLQETVPVQRVSVFDASVLRDHPLLAVRLDNDTGLHLAAGSSTIFDAGIFAGNARFSDILPGADALLSYAVDQAVDVQVDTQRSPRVATAVKLVNGLLSVTAREVATSEYRISGADDRLLAVEHPQLPGFELVQASPLPLRTDSGYRFGVQITAADAGPDGTAGTDADLPVQLNCAAAQPCTLTVTEERLLTQELRLTNLAADEITFYLSNVEVSDADLQVLQQVQALKVQLAELVASRDDAEAQRDRIAREQERIRGNMAELARDSDLYRRYVAQLQEQEDQLAALDAEWNGFNTDLQEVQRELDALLRGLGAE